MAGYVRSFGLLSVDAVPSVKAPGESDLNQSGIALKAILLLSLTCGSGVASENGIDGFSTSPYENGGASCLACHTQAPNSTATVEIQGPSVVDANSVNVFQVTLTGGPAATAGIDIAVDNFDGQLTALNDDLRRSDNDLTHRRPKPFTGGQVRFSFQWTAPSYNATTDIYAAANSSNGGRDLIGDAIATASLRVRVQNGLGIRPDEPQPEISLIKLETVASGLGQSISIANAGDLRMFVVDKSGKIRIVRQNGSVQQPPFLDISERVESTGGEQGLLGLAFDPNYANNGYFYVHYTRNATTGSIYRGRVSRFSVSSDAQRADESSEKVLLEIQRNSVTHNGGDLRFGNDGYLYISSGDGGEPGRVQNSQTLLGKILRIDVSGRPDENNRPDCGISPALTYRIPPGNAYRNGPGNDCDEIYALGLRNPWRISLDRETGDLWVGDVGKESREEISFIRTSDSGGVNLGWPCYEGTVIFDAAACTREFVQPVFDYGRDTGRAVVGGFVYRGNEIAALRGRYLFTDYGDSSVIYSLIPQAGGFVLQPAMVNTGKSLLSSFGEDAAGELYVLSAASSELYRIVAGETSAAAQFHVSSLNVSESASRASVSVRLSRPLQNESRVSIATSRQTAIPGQDYYGRYEILSLPAGSVSTTLDIPILDDALVEADETLGVRLFQPVGAEIGTESAQVTIEDNDASNALPTLNVSSVRVDENVGVVNIEVTLSSPATEPVDYAFSTSSAGTATIGVDLYGTGAAMVFQPGQQIHRLAVQIVDDNLPEPNEYSFLRVLNVSGATSGVLSGRIDIIDND